MKGKGKQQHELLAASNYLMNEVIPQFAKALETRYSSVPVEPFSSEELHYHGINCCFLGIYTFQQLYIKELLGHLYSHAESNALAMDILQEMIVRSVTKVIREKMKNLNANPEGPYFKLITEIFNLLFDTNTEQSINYWNTELRAEVSKKFQFTKPLPEKLPGEISLSSLFSTLSSRLNLTWTQDFLDRLAK